MIYLRTGANGSCKTLFTLADVRKLQLETGRPVCVNGRFKLKPEKRAEFGWNVAEFADWQAEPDGTIFLIDECHNDLPVRPNGSVVPEPVRMLAEHRARGFDFFLLTQHPMNIDSFVRKLVGAPGWHQHLKRVFGGTNVTRVLQWDAVRADCEKDGSGKTAQITTRTQPKEVYDWYDSASLHTAKTRIPKQMFVLAACLVVVPLLGWYGVQKMHAITTDSPLVAKSQASAPNAPPSVVNASSSSEKRPMTQAEYAQSFQPRLEGLVHTAPRYDELTKATSVPYPAACIFAPGRCECYTQQATKLPVPISLCKQIAEGGFFKDWGEALQQATPAAARPIEAAQPATLADSGQLITIGQPVAKPAPAAKLPSS